NKGLEVIEARWLFDLAPDQVQVVIHPQSIVHSMVEYIDGSVIAQLGVADMGIPILYALTFPERRPTPSARLDLTRTGPLTFESPDPDRFPALRLARAALEQGGAAPVVLNAANELAVAAFLERRIGFPEITQSIERALAAEPPAELGSIEECVEAMPYDPKKAFALKPLWARFLIVFAGPGMNFVLAVAIFAVVFATFGRPVWPAVVGRVLDGSPAAAAGIRSGDTVVEVNGRRVSYWEDLERTLADSGGRPVTARVKRADGEQTVTVTPRRKTVIDPIFGERREVWDIGAGPHLIPQISSVLADSPAQRAGLQPGDVVLAVAGQPVYTPEDLVDVIRTRPGRPFPITVERGGRTLTLTVTPRAVPEKAPATGQETT